MSLIQEALKRKHDTKVPPAETLLRPASSRSSGGASPAGSQTLPMVAIVVGGCSLLLVLVLMFVVFGRTSSSERVLEEGAVLQMPKKVSMKTGWEEPPVVPPIAKQPVASTSLLTSPAPQASIEDVAEIPQASRIEPVVVAPPEPVQPPPVKPVIVEAAKKSWPSVRVMGVLTNPDSDSDSVVINGVIRDPGERVSGVKVLRVESKGAWLSFNSQTQFVKVGRSYPE